MPRRKNLDIAEALGEDIDVTEDEANEANEIVAPEPRVTAPPAPPATVSLSMTDLQSIIRGAIEAAQGGQQQLAAAITEGIQSTTRHQNEFSPAVSVYNPAGDRDHPRPGLKCHMTLGFQHPKTKQIQPTYAFQPDDLTAYEQIALNTLEPWEGVVSLLDGTQIALSIVPTHNALNGSLERLVLVVPDFVTAKGSEKRNFVPSIPNLVAQITGRDYSTLSLDDLKWFMAEHREKRYVSERPTVAA